MLIRRLAMAAMLGALTIGHAYGQQSEKPAEKTVLYLGSTKVANVSANDTARQVFGIGANETFASNVTTTLRAYLMSHILQTRKFDVVEREGAGEVIIEPGVITNGLTADYAVLGNVLRLELNTRTSRNGVKIPFFDMQTAAAETDAELQIMLRVVDVRTLRVLATATNSASGSVSNIMRQVGVEFGTPRGDNETHSAQNNLIWPLVEAISRRLAISVLTDAFPIEISAYDEASRRAILNYGAPVLTLGQTLEVRDPPRFIGGVKLSGKRIGEIRVTELDPAFPVAQAEIVEGIDKVQATLRSGGKPPRCVVGSTNDVPTCSVCGTPRPCPIHDRIDGLCSFCGRDKAVCGETKCKRPAEQDRYGNKPGFMPEQALR